MYLHANYLNTNRNTNFLAESKFNMVAKEYVPKRLQVSEDLAKIIETKKGQKVMIPFPY